MVKHVILWQLKDELSDTEKAAVKAGIKEGLEGLAGQIPGLVDIRVNIDALPSSNADLMLDTTFESAEALKGYSTHPAHVAVANSKVRPYYKKPRLPRLRDLTLTKPPFSRIIIRRRSFYAPFVITLARARRNKVLLRKSKLPSLPGNSGRTGAFL